MPDEVLLPPGSLTHERAMAEAHAAAGARIVADAPHRSHPERMDGRSSPTASLATPSRTARILAAAKA